MIAAHRKLGRRLAGWGTTAALMVAFTGAADAVTVPKPLRAWLHATDASPTADQLRRASAHVHHELGAVARDPAEHRYARHRAIALLSRLSDDQATAILLGLRDLNDPSLRATLAVALAAGPGARQPERIAGVLADWHPKQRLEVRAAIARALAMLPAPAVARRAAVRLRRAEPDAAVRALLDRTIRAGAPASPPRKPSRKPRSESKR
ncbi:MAG: hypothetical protein RIT45_2904 [Pseudomonadota bacterium]|jgi:hypothetical protein